MEQMSEKLHWMMFAYYFQLDFIVNNLKITSLN
jgi:hypothetical protein